MHATKGKKVNKKKVIKGEMKNETPNSTGRRLLSTLHSPQTFTRLHQRQPGHPKAAAMVPFPALVRAMAALGDSEVRGADGKHVVVHEQSAAVMSVQVVAFQVPK